MAWFSRSGVLICLRSINTYNLELKKESTMLKKNKIVTALLFTGFLFSIQAQVSISPTNLFINSDRRFETLLVMNSSDVAQEVSLSWEFGYPTSDPDGNISMVYNDEDMETLHSAADWIRGFPKNFILKPGARQTIRVTVKAPRGLEAGTYWSRLKTSSTPVSAAVGSQPQGGITTQINIEFKQVTGVFYKQGELHTGLEIAGVRDIAMADNGTMVLVADFTKSGNSPFLGTMMAKVYDASNNLVLEEHNLVSIYLDGYRRLELNARDLPKGSYEYEISFFTGRADIPEDNVIPGPTVSSRGTFTKL